MMESIQALLADLSARFQDHRVHLVDVRVASLEANHLSLEGRVLDEATLQTLCHGFAECYPDLQVDATAVRILRKPGNTSLHVATNMTSVHAGPSWLAEMLSQNTFGEKVEPLDENGRWVLIRQVDGYLGWMYRPYLTDQPAPEPNYIVATPLAMLHAEPNAASPINSRLVGGTKVQIVSTRGNWAEVDANTWGWVSLEDLRALERLPQTHASRRKAIVKDAARMIGVPYLWGGTSSFGIDCSGLAQLLHRWSGLAIPRDADMQYTAGKKVEPPFQPGDLLFFGEKDEKRSITHVAISLGEWHVVHSSRSNNGVYMDNVQEVEHLRDSFIGAATYLG